MRDMRSARRFHLRGPAVALAAAIAALSVLQSCERKERVLDIKAPGVDIEVDKTVRRQGDVDVGVEVKKPVDGAKRKRGE
jgi:hypothetical protein